MSAIGSMRLNRMVNRMVKCFEADLCGAVQGPPIVGQPSSVLRRLAQAAQEKGLSPVETAGERSQQALWAASVLQ